MNRVRGKAPAMEIPFVDLAAQHRELADELVATIREVIEASSFIGGPHVQRFERNFADYCGAQFAVTCGSGTEALKLALMAARIGRGEEVVTVPNTFIATVEAITAVGAHPVFVDIDPETYNISPQRLEEFLETGCQRNEDGELINRDSGRPVTALLPVHLYGQAVDLESILDLGKRFDLKVVEDSAQSHGARYRLQGEERKVGTFGVAGAFSFYPGKNLGALGEGGAVITQDEELDRWMRIWRDHGQIEKYIHVSPDGWNMRLDALQCALLDQKLKRLDEWNQRRYQAAAWYRGRLQNEKRVVLPAERDDRTHVYHLFAIRVPERDRVVDEMGRRGVSVGLHYPVALHLQKAYTHLGYRAGDFPEAEAAATSTLSLPMFPHLSETQVRYVCDALQEALDAVSS